MESRRKRKLRDKIQHLARERWFLLSMKAKYAGKLQFDVSLNAYIQDIQLLHCRWSCFGISTVKEDHDSV